jgi:hypothetical protein
MYKLSLALKHSYNANLLNEFAEEECTQGGKNYLDLIKNCWSCPEKFRADTHGIYVTTSLYAHMMHVAMMLCRLFEKENYDHFLLSWVSIMHEVVEGFSFNWSKILSNRLAKEIA